MVFQGYICDCTSAALVMEIATKDLGIAEFKDGTEKGEGVWPGRGVNSSTPVNPAHVTLFYKDAEGNRYAFDSWGMTSGEKASCEAHGCREKLISLR